MQVSISKLLASVLIRILQVEAQNQAVILLQELADNVPSEWIKEREQIIEECQALKEQLQNETN